MHLTPNFRGAMGGPVAVARVREEDETEAQEWRNGWSKHLPAVMDGVYDCIGDKENEVRRNSWSEVTHDLEQMSYLYRINTICGDICPFILKHAHIHIYDIFSFIYNI